MNPAAANAAAAGAPAPAATPAGRPPRPRLVRALCIGVVALALLEFVIATTGVQILKLPPATDFASYYLAGALAREARSPYDAVALAARGHALGLAHDQAPFLYPPPFALAMQPFTRLSYPRARAVWMLLCTAALIAAVVWTGALLHRLATRHRIENRDVVWIVLAGFAFAALNSTSVHNDIRAGSVGIILYLALVAAAWGVLEGRATAASAAFAAAALLKLAPAAVIPWAAWRGARRTAALAVAWIGVAMLPALSRWGWTIVPEYARTVLLPILRREFPFPMNQSLDAVLSRLLVPNEYVQSWFDLPGLKHVLAAGLSIAVAALTLSTLRQRPRHPVLLPLELGYVVLALLMLMKITWLHTLCAMLFVWPCLMLAILRAAERGARWSRRAAVWASVGFFLSSAHIPVLWSWLRHGPGVLLISVHLVGLAILWIVSRGVLRHQDDCL